MVPFLSVYTVYSEKTIEMDAVMAVCLLYFTDWILC